MYFYGISGFFNAQIQSIILVAKQDDPKIIRVTNENEIRSDKHRYKCEDVHHIIYSQLKDKMTVFIKFSRACNQ